MPLLVIEGLTCTFGRFTAITKLDFSANEGELIGIIGPNGAGKTTLFNAICNSGPRVSGNIRFQGRSLIGLASHQICRLGIARTFQRSVPFSNMTVFENVVTAAYFSRMSQSVSEAAKRAKAALSFVGLSRWDMAASSLPLTERRLLELARALASSPKLLLLDEILAGVDPGYINAIVGLIQRARHEFGLTVLWIEHIMTALMQTCDRILVLSQGRKLMEGNPDAVAADPQVQAVYLGLVPGRR